MGIFDTLHLVWRFNRILLISGSFIFSFFQSPSFSLTIWSWMSRLLRIFSSLGSWNPLSFVAGFGIFSDAKISFLRIALYLLTYSAVDTLQSLVSKKSIFRSFPLFLASLPVSLFVPSTILEHLETIIIYQSLAYFLICEVVVWVKLSLIFDAKMLERIQNGTDEERDKWAYGYMGFGLILFGGSSYAIWSAFSCSWDGMYWWIISVLGLFMVLILAVYYCRTVIGSPPSPSIMFVALPWLFTGIVLCDAAGVLQSPMNGVGRFFLLSMFYIGYPLHFYSEEGQKWDGSPVQDLILMMMLIFHLDVQLFGANPFPWWMESFEFACCRVIMMLVLIFIRLVVVFHESVDDV
eukprot:TRINITY_DN332_c0_g2_i4.p1 TRINITY_DN332_c0_g2~~TRINITY_DN332_c0_g2_i4.p1  ORF type:complete len:350 (+),score=58.77 TRINITY_DN332_c0_g2_i4:916-1965(+)